MIGWMRLDTDFYRDMKFRLVVRKYGKQAAYDALCIYSMCAHNYGVLDLNDEMVRLWVLDELAITDKALETLLEKLADCALIDPAMLSMGKITSERLSTEGSKKRESEDKRRLAGEKSGQARRAKKEDGLLNTC